MAQVETQIWDKETRGSRHHVSGGGRQGVAQMTRKCAKCRDAKRWTKAENSLGDGVMWHWRRYGKDITCLAKRCMKKKTRWDGTRWILA